MKNAQLDDVIYRRIYTTFVLGTALQNSGTRANGFGHGPPDLHGKICSSFFNVDFWNGTPETGTALLNLWVPALIWQRFTHDFRRAFGALSRAVQKRKWQILDYKKQLYGLLLWKSENVCHNWGTKTRSSLAPLLHTLKRRQYGLLQAILGCLNPPCLREVWDASPFFCVVWHGRSIFSWWIAVFQL